MLSKSEIKYIQSLQQKKFRDSLEAFVAEGPKVVGELLLQNSFSIKKIYAVKEWYEMNGFNQPAGADIEIIEDYELQKISSLKSANQVLAILNYKDENEFIPVPGKVTLMLEEIRDPGNFGTIIRIADWFGISDLVCSPGCVDMYNPKVVQSTMASLGRVNIHYAPLEKVCEKFENMPLYAAALGGKSLPDAKITLPAFLVIGNEGSGLSEGILARAVEKIAIPGEGGAESLNAAVATGILLYAFTR